MPMVLYENDEQLDLYGDIHVSVNLNGETTVNMKNCKVIRAKPPGVYAGLLHKRIRLLLPDDEQPGLLLYRTPDLPEGKEEIVEGTIQISPIGTIRVQMPIAPDL